MFGSSSVLAVKGKIFAMLVKGRFVAKLPGNASTNSRDAAAVNTSTPATGG
jgi:hypothetical protein